MPSVQSPGVRIIAIGASAGGVPLLRRLVAALPGDLTAAVLILQHLSPTATSRLPWLLARDAALSIREATDGAAITAGTVYVAVPDLHLLVRPGHLSLVSSAVVHYVRPSLDRLLISMADAYGAAGASVVLSGTGQDGAAGVVAVKQAGGTTIVQDPDEAEYRGMPAAAVGTGCVDHVVRLAAIAPLLVRLTRHPTGAAA
jgi:two-component system, chemotaxis family, protein-glutamate methylesterase/glutaminase